MPETYFEHPATELPEDDDDAAGDDRVQHDGELAVDGCENADDNSDREWDAFIQEVLEQPDEDEAQGEPQGEQDEPQPEPDAKKSRTV